jgi:hypothetical protein
MHPLTFTWVLGFLGAALLVLACSDEISRWARLCSALLGLACVLAACATS